MRSVALLLAGLCFGLLPSVLNAADKDKISLPSCSLALDEEAQIPGQEPGVLDKVHVVEGQLVAQDTELAQIDDVIPKLQKRVATYKLNVAKEQARDDIDRQFAEASAKVAKAEFDQGVEANTIVAHTVPRAELRRRLLEWHKMELSVDKAKKDLRVNALQADVAQGELDAAEAMIKRRKLVAPFDAIVVELTKHRGEWVQAGEPVMRLVRIDRLRVDGMLEAKNHHQADIVGRPVEVVVTLPDNRKETFTGAIEYVKPMVEGERFQVRAKIQNRKLSSGWAVYPGMNAEMTILLK
jgi:multidrug efflux pump subunit AcrA (membrane-fusion protein)